VKFFLEPGARERARTSISRGGGRREGWELVRRRETRVEDVQTAREIPPGFGAGIKWVLCDVGEGFDSGEREEDARDAGERGGGRGGGLWREKVQIVVNLSS